MRSNVRMQIGLIGILIGLASLQAFAQVRFISITGHVEDSKSGAPLAGANVLVRKTLYGTTTDSLGNFYLSLKPGRYEVGVSRVGYKTKTTVINAASGEMMYHVTVSLEPSVYTTGEVVVSADRYTTSPSLYTIKAKDLKYIPTLYSDILKGMTILPGVSSNNELTSAYNVHGQNFSENLIYLDGFEIYRPYLVQQGIEENMSVINQNMVQDFKFYNAAFPVQFGDKMSSVLDVRYRQSEDTLLGGEVNADLLSTGLTLHDRIGRFSWIAGFRYSYPSSFTSVLQTKGSYIPRYVDFQLLSSYTLPDKIKMNLLFITARNSFNLTPSDWTGNFQYGSWDNFQRIYLKFRGNNNYSYNSNLLGLNVSTPLSSNSNLSTSFAYYSDKELYNENLTSDTYYVPDAYNPQAMSYLGTGLNYANNALTMSRFELKTVFSSNYGTHGTEAGITLRSSLMNNSLDEMTSYSSLSGPPALAQSRQKFVFNSISGYLAEQVRLRPDLSLNLGVRALKCYFNGQFLVSPRASASYQPNSVSTLNFGWGYYYQPPSFYQTRDKSPQVAKSLLAQRAIHYALRYERQYGVNTSLMAEVFYEGLSRLIPYSYTNELELTYGDSNNYEGYAYGFDLEYEGKLTQSLDTWIGYDYLNSQDRQVGGNSPYQRSLLDQTHTIRIFLQDAMPGIHNSQAHVRLLFGTGYLYHPLVNAPGTSPSNNPQMVPDYNVVEQYPWYYRVDMGLTYRFTLADKANVTLTADVFNVFDNRNVISYAWYYIPEESPQPVPVPNILSERYFNVGGQINF